MAAALNVYASNLGTLTGPASTGYQAYPSLTAGEGGPDEIRRIEDVAALTTAFLGTTTSYARLVRIPSRAKVKKVSIFTDIALDTGASPGLVMEFGWAFSDAFSANGMYDGTPIALAGLIPTTAANTTTTFAAHSSANAMYGTFKMVAASQAGPRTDLTFNSGTTTYGYLARIQSPLVELFGFTDGRGTVEEELGYMDLYAYVTVVASTAQAGNLFAEVEFTNQ